ncbi:MAG: AgmX/PglI C-terminal domain-containing protein [Myxococcota bacterium]
MQEIVRSNFDRLSPCYARAVTRDPSLRGTIRVRLAIGADGRVIGATADRARPGEPGVRGDALVDPEVVGCVEEEFSTFRFPETGRGMVTTVYPLTFSLE